MQEQRDQDDGGREPGSGGGPGPAGEDHREGPPGYDLDEQEAIEELEAESPQAGEHGDQ